MSMLGFFRKRQKLIFIIMVVLMVSFLIGFQGFSMLFDKQRQNDTIGKTEDETFTLDMYRQAGNDLHLLQRILPGFGMNSEQVGLFQSMYEIATSQDNVAAAYMLLQGEAEQAGYTVTEAEIDQAIADMTNRGFDFEGLAGNLRQNQSITLKSLKGVLGRWLMVFKCFQASNVIVPPSRIQLLNFFRDINEKIELSVVKIPADSLLEKIDKAEPTEEQIKEMFDKYKNRSAGQFSGFDSFPFGYIQEPKVKLAYLFINQAAIERVSIPPLEDLQDYYNDNKYSYLDKDGKAKSFPAAKKEIINTLAPEAGQAKFQQVLADVQEAIRRAKLTENAGPVDAKKLAEIAASFTIPADELLQRKIPIIAIENQPLEDAIETLAKMTKPGLSAICFPWGKFENITIDPEVKVSLVANNITVAEALDKIAAQIPDMPKLQWACFPGFDGVLFPVKGLELFPVTAGQTGLNTPNQFKNNKLIISAVTQAPMAPLLQWAFSAKPINPDGKLQAGQEGPPASFQFGADYAGTLLWILEDAQPAKSPEEITPELKKQIVKDWKLTQAFDLAVKETEKIKTAKEMEDFQKAQKLTALDTGMFARRMDFAGQGRFDITELPMLKFNTRTANAYFIKNAFEKLTPEDFSKPYGQTSENAMVLPLKCESTIYLARRTNFIPATEQNFEKEKNGLISPLQQSQYAMNRLVWVSLNKIVERTGFVETTAGQIIRDSK